MFFMMPILILTFKNGLDGPRSIYLHISAILKQIITSVTQFKSKNIDEDIVNFEKMLALILSCNNNGDR